MTWKLCVRVERETTHKYTYNMYYVNKLSCESSWKCYCVSFGPYFLESYVKKEEFIAIATSWRFFVNSITLSVWWQIISHLISSSYIFNKVEQQENYNATERRERGREKDRKGNKPNKQCLRNEMREFRCVMFYFYLLHSGLCVSISQCGVQKNIRNNNNELLALDDITSSFFHYMVYSWFAHICSIKQTMSR